MIIAVDTGGTKTLVAAFSDAGTFKTPTRFTTPNNATEYILQLTECIQSMAADTAIAAISVAVPGVVHDGVIHRLPNLSDPSWENFALADELHKHMNVPVIIENDANLAGLAETRALPKVPALSLYMTYSTGIGCGISLDGKLHPALSNTEGGHAVLEYDGALQDWEDVASGSAIVAIFGKNGSEIHDEATWRNIADRMSRGLLSFIPLLQPNVVIFGGGLGEHFGKYSEALEKLLDERLPSYIIRPKLTSVKHGAEAVLYGCYYHAIDHQLVV